MRPEIYQHVLYTNESFLMLTNIDNELYYNSNEFLKHFFCPLWVFLCNYILQIIQTMRPEIYKHVLYTNESFLMLTNIDNELYYNSNEFLKHFFCPLWVFLCNYIFEKQAKPVFPLVTHPNSYLGDHTSSSASLSYIC